CPPRRAYSTPSAPPPEPPDYLNEAELRIFNKVKVELEPVRLEVQDISGGCGTMYALEIESPKFQGLTVFKQHKMVNEVLKEDIKGWHGVQLRTKAA
ncbi:bola-like protein, partial [Lentithecium fluviatile CBS 122367]